MKKMWKTPQTGMNLAALILDYQEGSRFSAEALLNQEGAN